MTFARLEILWILLPAVVLVLAVKWTREKNYCAHPLLSYLRTKIPPASRLVHLPKFLELLALALLIVALLDPVLPSSERLVVRSGLDILLVLDLSSSMQEPIDLKGALDRQRRAIQSRETTRLEVVKDAMAAFVRRRHDDRMAVVVFSENGYVVAPMTFDTAYLTRYLSMVDHKTLASEGQTAIGEGILTSLDLASRQPRQGSGGRKGKVMIILTDGENNTGRDVFAAIASANKERFKIYFIGVDVEKARDAPRIIAAVEATGGKYYNVRDAEQIKQAYLDINRTEKGTFLVKIMGKQVPWFYPFALASLLSLALSLVLRAIPYFTEIS